MIFASILDHAVTVRDLLWVGAPFAVIAVFLAGAIWLLSKMDFSK